MEKLIELLNEREKIVNGVQNPGWCKEHLEYQCHGPRVINKRFGFIKWLVENDKIDRPKVGLKIKDLGDDYGWFTIYSGIHIECLIMLLSISDTPIEDLISILK